MRTSTIIHTVHEVAAFRRKDKPFRWRFADNGWSAAIRFYAGLDVDGKKSAVFIVDETGRIVWQISVDTHLDMIGESLKRWHCKLVRVGLESSPLKAHLNRSLATMDRPMVCIDARRTADVIKSFRIKSEKGDVRTLAEMLRTGWFSDVHVMSVDTHRLQARLHRDLRFIHSATIRCVLRRPTC